jgi:hypothetical protein
MYVSLKKYGYKHLIAGTPRKEDLLRRREM